MIYSVLDDLLSPEQLVVSAHEFAATPPFTEMYFKQSADSSVVEIKNSPIVLAALRAGRLAAWFRDHGLPLWDLA
ncbi:MAG: hypothetical protein HQM16_09480 [Deltaproteobacteria bacterium]|nr:hypothetical protein [Deltaproteobacteria bacterium]